MSERMRMIPSNDAADVSADLQNNEPGLTSKKDDRGQGHARRHRVDTGAGRPERRRSLRGGARGEPARADLVALILGTYDEMPGLSLHPHQAARLFGLREETCLVVLKDLVEHGELRQSADGQYRGAKSAGV